MSGRTRRALVAATLSLLAPGAGQLYGGARRRASVLFTIWAGLCLGALGLLGADPVETVLGAFRPAPFVGVLLANAAVLAFRLYAIVDAGRAAAAGLAGIALAVIVAVAAAPHVAAGYVLVRSYGLAGSVFAEEEPRDVLGVHGLFIIVPPLGLPPRDLDPPVQRPLRQLPGPAPKPFRGEARPLADAARIVAQEHESPEPPWVTILLLGSDRGPGQAGDRTDAMIVAAIQRETRRAVLFGVPRNLVGVPLGGTARFSGPLNALYRFAHTRPVLFPGGTDPGATALKQAISRLLGLRITYYALVDLDGFVDLVDALGGVKIHVQERLVDEVTRPAWGETKPRIDVYPGRTYHFTGRTALAYVRSRKASNDYRRMARQRCFVSAMARQLDVASILRHFRPLATAIETSVRTDIPLNRAPDLAHLAAAVDARQTLTETFGPTYFAGRRTSDRYPIPNLAKIRAAVRDAILDPDAARARRKIDSVQQSC